jgi:hypothetical protein
MDLRGEYRKQRRDIIFEIYMRMYGLIRLNDTQLEKIPLSILKDLKIFMQKAYDSATLPQREGNDTHICTNEGDATPTIEEKN